jgi:hypothetical protein
MPTGWVWLSLAIAVVSLTATVLAVADAYPFDQLALLLTAGILVPIWALWLAIRVETLSPASSADTGGVGPGG